MISVVKINGSPTRPSKTEILINAIGASLAAKVDVNEQAIALADVGHSVMCGLTRPDVSAKGEQLLQLAERADVLIVGTPVYRASYTGLLKHFFDLVDRDAMRGRRVILCATGGSPLHGLMLEHQLRPLMGFFAMQTVQTGIYGLSDDFQDGRVVSSSLLARIDQAASEVVDLLPASRARIAEVVS